MELRVSLRSENSPDASASLFQSDFWAEFKAEFGWRALRFYVESAQANFQLLVLVRRLGRAFSFAYVPLGPELELQESDRAAFLTELSEALRPFLPRLCLFLRFDPPWSSVENPEALEAFASGAASAEASIHAAYVEAHRPSIGSPLRRAVSDIQPPDTVLIDLRQREEDILASMKSKWRYNIRQAEKKAVMVESAGIEAIPEFYRLSKATAARDRIELRGEGYYRRLFSLSAESRPSGSRPRPELRLWIARHEGRALAATITLFFGDSALYLYGASSDEERNLMPTYALQWAAMVAAKKSGCLSYDLYGIPPTEDPSHPMAGLYRFKTGFGGKILHRAGSWDYALTAPGYTAYRSAEAARSWWFKNFKKRFRGARSSH